MCSIIRIAPDDFQKKKYFYRKKILHYYGKNLAQLRERRPLKGVFLAKRLIVSATERRPSHDILRKENHPKVFYRRSLALRILKSSNEKHPMAAIGRRP